MLKAKADSWFFDITGRRKQGSNDRGGIYVYDAYVYTLDMPCFCSCCADLELTLR